MTLDRIKNEALPVVPELRNKILQVSNGLFRAPVLVFLIGTLVWFLPHHFTETVVNIYNPNGLGVHESIIHHINTRNLFVFNLVIGCASLLLSGVLYVNAKKQGANSSKMAV